MLTCYVKNFSTNRNQKDDIESLKLYPLIVLPLFYIASTLYLFIRIYKTRNAILCLERKKEIIKFLVYSIIYAFFNFPTLILYVITVGVKIEPNTFLSWFSYFCFIANISINLILSLLRIFQGHINIDIYPNDTMGVSDLSQSDSESNRSFSINNFFNRTKTNLNQNHFQFNKNNININQLNENDNDNDNNIKEKLLFINENNIIEENSNEKNENLLEINNNKNNENSFSDFKKSLDNENIKNLERKSNKNILFYFIKL
jgi:hypothetical protein